MKIVIAGGTGFIGRYLAKRYRNEGHQVIVITRNTPSTYATETVQWCDPIGLNAAINGANLLINMAGKSVDCRYNAKNRAEIKDSRLKTTKLLSDIVSKVEQPPSLWINSSTATIYRHAEDRPMTEDDGDIGTGFSVDVATSWEQAFFENASTSTRKVALRTAIVLGKGGGAFEHFKMLTNIGFGGQQGNGNQMVSFVHIEDVFRTIEFVRTNLQIEGVVNVSAPNPVSNKVFMNAFKTALGKSIALPIPAWMLEIGAFFLQTETELLLKSRFVLPHRLNKYGFSFKYRDIGHTLQKLMSPNQ